MDVKLECFMQESPIPRAVKPTTLGNRYDLRPSAFICGSYFLRSLMKNIVVTVIAAIWLAKAASFATDPPPAAFIQRLQAGEKITIVTNPHFPALRSGQRPTAHATAFTQKAIS